MLVASARTGRLRAAHDLRDARRLRLLPGSAIKPWTALALLRSGVVTGRERIECRRVVPGYGPRFACSHPPLARPFGLRTALAESCNYFFLTVSQRLPRSAWIGTLASYGLHPDPYSSRQNLPLMAIGVAGIHVTPWTLLQAWRKLVWRMSHSDDPDLQLVRQGLIECVRNGTGRAAGVPGWQVMGKTGTAAEVPDGRTHAWFLAAAPAQDPRILVLVATATGSGEGDAAVIAGRVLGGWLSLIREQAWGERDSETRGGFPASQLAKSPVRAASITPLVRGPKGLPSQIVTKTASKNRSAGQPAAGGQDEILLQVIRATSGLRLSAESSSEMEFDSGNTDWDTRGAIMTAGPGGWTVKDLNSGERKLQWNAARITVSSASPIQLTAGAQRLGVPGQLILRWGEGRGEVLARLGMDAYVAGVLVGEASGMPYAAQQAMAVVARTWARTHRGRHRREGFDFCSTTHCQVWRWAQPGSEAWRAAVSTRGEEVDYHGRPALVFYSANCGGETEAGGPPWTPHPEPYLVAQPDPYCLRHPRRWRFRIARAPLARWLVREGLFSQSPADLRIQVAQRDQSGRARWLSISGPPLHMVSAEGFRFDVDRRFGWNRIESTLFTVHQSGGYVFFSGRGLGHGVGLCQAGASEMAREGFSWRAILAHYFPGTQVIQHPEGDRAARSATPRATSEDKSALFSRPIAYRVPLAPKAESPRWRFLVDSGCQIRYEGAPPRDIVEWCRRLLGRAESLLGRQAKGEIHLIVYSTPAGFIRKTGEPAWKAAVTRGNTIRLQPEWWLEKRGRLQTVLQHELLLAVMQSWLRSGVDACQQEGLVLALSGEGAQLPRVKVLKAGERQRNARLLRAQSAGEFTAAMAACYQAARQSLRQFGRGKYLDRVLR